MTSFFKLFLVIFIPITTTLFIGFYFNYTINYNNAKNNFYEKISNEWQLINNISLENMSSLKIYNYLKKISESLNIRVTIISENGEVIIDTAVAYNNISSMENHKNREEVKEAINNNPKVVLRKSPTTNELTLYYAKKIDNKILRIAKNVSYLEDIKKYTLKSSAIIFICILLICFFISIFIAKSISKPLKSVKKYCDAINNGINSHPLPFFKDKAINEIAETIYLSNSKLIKEKELANIEREILQTIFASMDEAIILFSNNGEIIHINYQANNYLDTELKKGMNIYNNIRDIEIIQFFKDISEKAINNTYKIVYKNNIFEVYSKLIKNNFLCVFKDVTDISKYEIFKTELIGNIIHEIKTPLSVIMGGAETVLKDSNMPDNIKGKFIDTIFRNSKRLNNIIDDITELHRLELSKENIDIKEPTNIEDILKDISILIDKKDKEITYNYTSDTIFIKQEHIESIIINFVNNAIKYSTGKNIFVTTEKRNNKFIISVADEGPVICEKERKRIFERFYTISQSRTKSSSGTGLGLSIVKHIAKLYNGNVKVTENEMKGNTFKAILIEKNINKEIL